MSSKNLAFIHIPKTGGTYIGRLKLNRNLNCLGHSCVINTDRQKPSRYPPSIGILRTIPYKEISKYYVFSVVRNPFDWLVSYAAHAGGWNPVYCDKNHYDYIRANKGFDYLVKSIVDRTDTWPNRNLLFFQLFCDDGKFIIDRLLKTETLDVDLSILASAFGITYNKIPKQRVGIHDKYKTYYTDHLIDIVQNTWKQELNLFGYDFEGTIESNIPFNESIDKTKYSYNHTENIIEIV